ncbi:MAG: hypothetical protein CVU39_13905 [Chloroflexi bacterium HGW-Chloroflexi-10]|nr:MAG: hypothetical protein CVU39_13905 [Chloroflexi bacterium HGW-Chloroflexi-10]
MFLFFISFLTFAYSYSKAINKKITCPRGLYSPVCVTSLFGFQRSLPVNLMYSQHTRVCLVLLPAAPVAILNQDPD